VTAKRRRILVIDIGGSHVKMLATGERRPIKIVSGSTMTPAEMAVGVRAATAHWQYDVVSIGYPGPVIADAPVAEPAHLGAGWVGFGYAAAFERPIRIRNDAAMQALGGYRGGRMLFLGLGTGLGSALIVEGHLQPLELAHLPYRKKKTFEEYVGEASRVRRGKRRWERFVIDVAVRLKAAMQADHLLIGGGNARHLRAGLARLPEGTRLGSNADAFRGGMRLWLSADERVAATKARSGGTTSR
jgi:polyphosphate glucokinase